MPTDRGAPRRPHPDDAYVVDTRRRVPRPTATTGGPEPDADDGYVVDTRTRPRPWSAGSAPTGTRVRGDDPGDPGGPPGDAGGPTGPPTGMSRERRRRLRRTLVVVGLVLLAAIGWLVWVPMNAWNAVARVDNIPDGTRPVDTSGYNYLLVGSDSREGLTQAQRKALATGSAEGKRTDTIMLVHVSESGGKPVMVSLPRDSFVPIPGHGSNKINAAYAFGGAKLLTTTVENVTGIHIDGYVEIGLGGFASVVDSLGGVDICVPRNMKDPKAGIDLKKGCQTLNGPNALGYVRSRYEDPMGDIGRAARQRQFLGALMKKAATPSTVLVPWRYKSFSDSAALGLVVGDQTGLMDAVRVLQAMRAVSNGQGLSLSVPTSDLSYRTYAGLAIKWDTERARALFAALKNDEPLTEPPAGTVPDGVVKG
ncbi:transcriptional regulator [Intrasporangium oryzae NRRL B-24470]|uniref:Transcriptional regulator n=1 Tax=Intrasporangium oryzae NRRL B-24470 TaxID=1386089 RepID=W9G2I6_9MICO|nr:LCP family protein [Intrasporangium oryzae]EWT00210.1 transcriptional regulator [Intrasporangium oryzae NRRL B-24470]